MPLGNSGWFIPVEVMVLALFVVLALLGAALLQLIAWETAFRESRDLWLQRLRIGGQQLRAIRRMAERAGEQDFSLPLPPKLQRPWRIFQWVTSILSAKRAARS